MAGDFVDGQGNVFLEDFERCAHSAAGNTPANRVELFDERKHLLPGVTEARLRRSGLPIKHMRHFEQMSCEFLERRLVLDGIIPDIKAKRSGARLFERKPATAAVALCAPENTPALHTLRG